MTWNGFVGSARIHVRASYLCERLELRTLETTQRLAAAPLTVRVGTGGCAVLFRYGVVVAFNVDEASMKSFLDSMKPLIVGPLAKPETEDVDLVLVTASDEGVENNAVKLQSFVVERLQLIADVLAKSVVLAQYEASIAQIFDRIEPLAAQLQAAQSLTMGSRELLRHVGAALLIHHKMVGRVEVREKPDLLWTHPELERLFLRLEDEYEIVERHTALERKAEVISRTAETMIDLMRHRSNLRVEWYIVILIVFEIILNLYDKLV